MKVLVTGATGFVGYALSERLKQAGYEVSVLGRNPLICAELATKGFRVVQADLTDSMAIVDACHQQQLVFHCGACSKPFGPYREFYEANVIGTKNVVAGCIKHGIQRLIHVSTPSIYFNFSDQHNISETTPLPLKSVNAYAQTKLLAEQEIDRAHAKGLEVITLRPKGIFGPGDTAILPRLMKAHDAMPLPLFKAGKVLIDITYIDNVIDALMLAIQAPPAALGKKFNISNGQPLYFIDVLRHLFAKLQVKLNVRAMNYTLATSGAWLLENYYRFRRPGLEPPFTRYTLGVLAFDQTLDIALAQNVLGYDPKISIDEGLTRFVASLQKT